MIERIFESLGRLAARRHWPIILAWAALTLLVALLAPNLDQVSSSDMRDMLPTNAPFSQAEATLRAYFPGESATGSAALVLEAPDGIRAEATWAALTALTDWLNSDDAPENLTHVTSPAGDTPLLADALVSEDDQAAIILLKFDTDSRAPATVDALAHIRAYLAEHLPPGVRAYITGSSPVVIDYTTATMSSVDRTTGVTVVLVVLILLLVYRSPVSPVVPLITVGASYLISRGVIAWLGASVMRISSYTHVMLIVVLFGAGTDYCLFLISRFREELAARREPHPPSLSSQTERGSRSGVGAAVAQTVHRVGETITSSAGTVIVGFVTMAFAEMGLFRTSGPALAVGVVVVLLAGLTLTPALLAAMGERVFWPRKAAHREAGRFYARLSLLVSQRPVLVIVVVTLALAPLALYATGQRTTYDLLGDLPQEFESRAGFEALSAHMDGGQMQPVNVVIEGLDPQTALAEIARWTEAIRAVPGVGDVRSLSDPLGRANADLQGLTSIPRQLALAADLLGRLGEGEGASPITPEQLSLALAALPFFQDYLTMLETDYPQVAGNADLQAVRETLAALPVAALTGRLSASVGTLREHLSALAETFAGIENATYLPESLPEGLTAALGGQDILAALTERYITADRTAARFEVIMAGNPFGETAMDAITQLRAMIPGGVSAVSGLPAVITDLRDTMQRDTLRAFTFVLLGVFAVLLFLLRALVAPIYLILTILLSYGATMGITRLTSSLVFGTDALTWWVPFFMLVVLIALGMDYNIFLMGRVREEAHQHGMREGVHQAVIATGAIITSAGIIMAGTFSAMMSSIITGLVQLGFAVAVGVLLDTFIIRTTLVPAIAVLLDRWNWWPRRAPQAATPAGGEPAVSRVEVVGD